MIPPGRACVHTTIRVRSPRNRSGVSAAKGSDPSADPLVSRRPGERQRGHSGRGFEYGSLFSRRLYYLDALHRLGGLAGQDEKLSGRRDPADAVDAAARRDAMVGLADGGGAALASDGLDRRPAHQPRALFVMRPRRTAVSDSRCLGVSPAHEQSWSARESGTRHRSRPRRSPQGPARSHRWPGRRGSRDARPSSRRPRPRKR